MTSESEDDYTESEDDFEDDSSRASLNKELTAAWWTFARLAASQVSEPKEDTQEGADTESYYEAQDIVNAVTDDLSALTDEVRVDNRIVYDHCRAICDMIWEIRELLTTEKDE